MGCKTSKITHDYEYFEKAHSRPDSPSIYSSQNHSTPSHSRNHSRSNSDDRPHLSSKFSDSNSIPPPVPEKWSPVGMSKARLLSMLNSHGGMRGERTCFSCNRPRLPDQPCFSCLREKPKPRRHRSRRNAQVLIPRASIYTKQKRRRSASSDTSDSSYEQQQPLRRVEEEQAPWVKARHGVFVPARVASELSASITEYEERSRRIESTSTSTTTTQQMSEMYARGGYVVSAEAYYSSLPLPDIPTQHAPENKRGRSKPKVRKEPVWI